MRESPLTADREASRTGPAGTRWRGHADAGEYRRDGQIGHRQPRGPGGDARGPLGGERVVSKVPGVRAIANDLKVRWNQRGERTSTGVLLEEVARALSWTTVLPLGAVKATLAEGWVTLSGTVDSEQQRDAAERAVRQVAGLSGVSNVVVVRDPANTAPARHNQDQRQSQRVPA